jgi:hypothetical protein
MSGKNLELSLTLRLRDLMSGGAARAQRDLQSGLGKTTAATENLTRTVANLGKQRAAAEVLGIRTEQNIQREIQRTEAAYNRLAKSGSLATREQARAAEALRIKLRELNNEMGKFTLAQRAANGLRTGAALGGAAVAGGYVMSRPISQTMDYGVRLAQMSNTAFSERDTLGRILGKKELNSAIVNAVRVGGGTRDDAASALDTLIASGAMSGKDAMSMLPTLMKSATASGADATELAQIGIRGMQTFDIKPQDLGYVMDMAITAGQAGGFELKDMAKWLPQQMAAAKMAGMTGTAGMAKLLAANQAALITAGSKDEAGNNLVNLLAKISSQDTAKDAQRLGINLSGTLAAARAKGTDSLDAFVGIVDNVVGKDANYQALQAKLKTAQGADRKAILESQADILQGSAIGKLVQDRQALMALVGVMGNRDYMAGVEKKTLTGAGATEKNHAVIAEEAGFKAQQAANEKTFATTNAFEKLTPLVGAVADGFTSIAREYPVLTAVTVAATTALTALAAAAGAASLATALGGKGAGLTGILAKGKDLVAAASGGSLLGKLSNVAKSGVLLGGMNAGAVARGGALALGTGSAMVAGAGVASYQAGSALMETQTGERFAGWLADQTAKIMAALGNREAQQIVTNLNLDGEQIATVVNNVNSRNSRRN